MIFENNPISIEHLPSLESMEYQGLEPNYLKVSYVGNAIFFCCFVVGFVACHF